MEGGRKERVDVAESERIKKQGEVQYTEGKRKAEKDTDNRLRQTKVKPKGKGEMAKVREGFLPLVTYISIMSRLRAVVTMGSALPMFWGMDSMWPEWNL